MSMRGTGSQPVRWIEVGGCRLEVAEIRGESGLAPVVFLHEGLGCVALWRDFPARVAEGTGRRAVIYSRTGHGQSDLPDRPRAPDFMHDEALEVLPELLDMLNLHEPLLIGHSDGASIALIHAARASRPVGGLVLLAPHVFVEEEALEGIARARRAFEETELRRRMGRYHRDPERTFRLWSDIWLAPDFRGWNIERCLPAIDCPVLLVQGTEDQYGTMRQLDAIERGVSGTTERLVPACRHSPHLEARAETLAAVTAFLTRLS